MTPTNVLHTLAASLLLLVSTVATAVEHRSFDTPEAAASALIEAVRAEDLGALAELLGPGGDDILESGDPVDDAQDRAAFLAAFDAKHSLVADGKDRRTLVIGPEDWPFPVPVAKKDGRWVLDGAAGHDELVFRRIGGNELGAIAVMRGFVDAQKEYAAAGHDGDPAGIYALKLVSDEGRRNGLYWPTADGEPPSPAGEFVAAAAAEGYRLATTAYHGYRYRMLYRQGPNAKGGARDYFEDGVLTEGFALLAWPAEYGVSGIKSFIVNQDGVVFEADLGAETDARANALSAFDPDRRWKRVP